MSARFWLIGMTATGMSLIGGLSLGLYATTAPRSVVDQEIAFTEPAQRSDGDYTPQYEEGPTVIDCKGCGPTLEERRFAADMAKWDGYQDSLVQEFMSDQPVSDNSPEYATVAQPLPPEDSADAGGSPVTAGSAQLAQGGASIPAVAVPTGSY